MLEAVAVSLSRSAVPDAPTLNALLGTIPVCSKGTCERGVMKTQREVMS